MPQPLYAFRQETPNGEIDTFSSQALAGSTQINTRENLSILQVFKRFAFDILFSRMNPSYQRKFKKTGLCDDTWFLIFFMALPELVTVVKSFKERILPDAESYTDERIKQLAGLLTSNSYGPSLFRSVENFVSPKAVLQAILLGDHDLLTDYIHADPASLLERSSAVNFSGKKFNDIYPLQAAIACGDFAVNNRSEGMVETIVRVLREAYPDEANAIIESQTLEIYTKSLKGYLEKQIAKIKALGVRKENGEPVNHLILEETVRLQSYQSALDSKDLEKIIHLHTNPHFTKKGSYGWKQEKISDAQYDHVCEVDPLLIRTLENSSDTEIQQVIDNPEIDTPLSSLVKSLRAQVDAAYHSELIYNPRHLLKLMEQSDELIRRFHIPGIAPYAKKAELFNILVQYVMRYLPACEAQILSAEGKNGLYRVAPDSLNNGGGKLLRALTLMPLDFNSFSGLGYQFRNVRGDSGTHMFYSEVTMQAFLHQIKIVRLHSFCMPDFVKVDERDVVSLKL